MFGRLARRALREVRAAIQRPYGPAILMYHRVAAERFDPWGMAVAPDRFAEQIAWLAARRTVLPLAEFADRHRAGTLPSDAIAITFDDGYADVAESALPILERYAAPATIFLPVELIERGREFWWDELEHIVLGSAGPLLRLGGEDVDIGPQDQGDRCWATGDPPRTHRQHAYRRLWSALRPLPPTERDRRMAELRPQAPAGGAVRRPMSVETVRASRGTLVAFGSHALTHAALPSLTSVGKAREIRDSMARCADLVGEAPRTFAYPYGDHDPESERLAEQAGFTCACTTEGHFVTAASRRFALPRLWVGNWQPRQLARLLAGA